MIRSETVAGWRGSTAYVPAMLSLPESYVHYFLNANFDLFSVDAPPSPFKRSMGQKAHDPAQNHSWNKFLKLPSPPQSFDLFCTPPDHEAHPSPLNQHIHEAN